MTNVIHAHFEQHHLHELALNILDTINEMGEQRTLHIPEVLGVLELVKMTVINDSIEAEYDDE